MAWAAPASALGLALTALLLPFGADLRVLEGVLEVCLRVRSTSSSGRESRRRLAFAAITAYFSPSWTAFQADRGRDFSVIVDGVSN